MTDIYEIAANGSGARKVAVYSLPPEKALVAYLRQKTGDFDTWAYPETLTGITKSRRIEGAYNYLSINGNGYCAMPCVPVPERRGCVC